MTATQRENTTGPQRRLAVLMAVAAAISTAWAYRSMAESGRSVDVAEADLADARRMVKDIERLKQRPKVAALYEQSPSEIIKRVSTAMNAAGLSSDVLMKVEPRAPIRIDRTDYKSRSTKIVLDGVTLESAIRFAHSLEDESSGAVVQRMQMLDPDDGKDEESPAKTTGREQWNTEITLTQTIFSPTVPEQ